MSLFKKTTIGIFLGLSVFTIGNHLVAKTSDQDSTKSATFLDKRTLSIEGRQTVYQPMLLAPYKNLEVFISQEKKSNFDFTSIGLAWDEIAPEGTKVEGEVRFKSNDKWTQWIELEEEEDLVEAGKKYAMAATNPTKNFQYKFLLYGDGLHTPMVQNTEWTFIKAGSAVSQSTQQVQSVQTSPFPSPQFAAATLNTNVISRSQWGADESYRYMIDNTVTPQLVELDEEWYERFADELHYSRVVEADENGNKYKWPLQYPEKVKKIIIHHTATTANLDNPTQAIRDIYHYHAITRGWGDIGYNYIVDNRGRIYEGRYGGEGVIGAHSGPGNHGSIGIALLGNFQSTLVSEEAIVGTSQFIYKKAKIHEIEPEGFSDFRAELMPNIFGHRDIMSTQCPGEFLYAKLPIIRTLANVSPIVKEKFVNDYDFQDLTELYYLELKPEELKEVELRIENIGKIDWNNETFIVVDQNSEFDGVISFPTKQGSVLAMMEEDLTEPGEVATFKFQVQAYKNAKSVHMNITPLMNGTKKLTEYIVLPVTVQPPVYKYEFNGAKYPPAIMKAGDEFDGFVRLKNVGNITWHKTGESKVGLNVSGIDAILQEDSVEPGQTATFKFNFIAQDKAGYYPYSFTPQISEGNFIGTANISFATTVYKRDYDSVVTSKTLVTDWEREKPYTFSIQLRNIGKESWHESDLKVAFIKDSDLRISNLELSPKTIAMSETGTIRFTVKARSSASLGTKNMIINPTIKGEKIMIPPLIKYEVKEKQFQTTSTGSENIRIKLSFSGNPEITANGSFEVYSGTNLLATLNAGEIVSISKTGDNYNILANDMAFIKTEPVRFIPKNSAILKLNNFEHLSSWNNDLNDNEYRGNLEVIDVDGTLIVINELALEDYLRGLGEVPNSEAPEKIKAIMIAARSYAYYYMTLDEKFPGKPYNLEDDPNTSQKYLGYGFEKRAPNVAAAAVATFGKVLTYNGVVIKAPYFSQSDGTRTKSALEVWGWTFAPYLVSVDDSFCDGDAFAGHGVGMSGCGARGMANQGYTYEEILKHYYTGIEIASDYGR